MFFYLPSICKNKTKGTRKHCKVIVEGMVRLVFSTEISVSTEAPKVWDNFLEKINSVVKKLNQPGITKDTEYFSVDNIPSPKSTVEGNENSASGNSALQFRGEFAYRSESAESLSLLTDELNKQYGDVGISFSMSRYNDRL